MNLLSFLQGMHRLSSRKGKAALKSDFLLSESGPETYLF